MIYRMYRQLKDTVLGFYIETRSELSENELQQLRWLIAETFEPKRTSFELVDERNMIVEIGPRLSIETPFSSNAVSICRSMGLGLVSRVERTRIFKRAANMPLQEFLKNNLDRMTEQHYPNGIETFETGIFPEKINIIDLIGKGKAELERVNKEQGYGMDSADIDYNFHFFVEILHRNPTNAELLQLGNANSEHSRHWYFKGKILINGETMPSTLFEIVQRPLITLGKDNSSLIAFRDNAGAIKGFKTQLILPICPGFASELKLVERLIHITCTAETHNHPTMWEPFEGATTGGGGRDRDQVSVGKGGRLGFGLAGYAVANLHIPGYMIPGEMIGKDTVTPFAAPLSILIKGSNGVSAYGNQIGEPLLGGFCRTFEQMFNGERRGFRKPILYTAGVGHLFHEHVEKEKPEVGMFIVRIGGPAYPVGVGGGAASSIQAGGNSEALDFSSVQRGNAEMGNRAVRVITACVELGDENPISSIHDQGAGGPSNVLTELLEPLGGRINIRGITLGDKTMSVMNIWSAEFQEGYGLLIKDDQSIMVFQSICERERVNCEILGQIDGSKKVFVYDPKTETVVVDLELEKILGKLPQKEFKTTRRKVALEPLLIPLDLTVKDAIKAVLKLPSVGSKGFLVNKVDRSVKGLTALQQCCGIAQIPIADCSISAQSHFGFTGSVAAIGEQPIKMLINAKAGARMAVGEMLTNISSARIRNISDIKCRANWMYPAKLPNEGAYLYDAASAMSGLLIELGIAVDGGKDSLSMAANVSGELVKAPGSLVVVGYAPIDDIRKKVTPDIKTIGGSILLLIDLGNGKNRLGGSAFAQSLNQLGDESPDVEDPNELLNAHNLLMRSIDEGLILSMHDRSDGGLITSVIEMCAASNSGFNLIFEDKEKIYSELFNEELGWVIEVGEKNLGAFVKACNQNKVRVEKIGCTTTNGVCSITSSNFVDILLDEQISELRSWWENTSYELERIQMDAAHAEQEYFGHKGNFLDIRSHSSYKLTFVPKETKRKVLNRLDKPRVAILREEGTNGDREMQAACFAAGLAPWDVTMSDLLRGTINLDIFQGIIFAGGFSYMDVFDSAKGWAGAILFNTRLREMFDHFYERSDTFSLGVCNGCQLMALLGWAPIKGIDTKEQPRFIHNASGKFESRWLQVKVLNSPAVLLKGMEGSKLGVWVAHGEGRLVFPDDLIRHEVEQQSLTPLAYIDSYGHETIKYPFNPNGSPFGIASLCSEDGRHLAMMPHPERCFRLWQWPWMPASWSKDLEASPWLQMFQNARNWCVKNRK